MGTEMSLQRLPSKVTKAIRPRDERKEVVAVCRCRSGPCDLGKSARRDRTCRGVVGVLNNHGAICRRRRKRVRSTIHRILKVSAGGVRRERAG